MTAPSRIPIRVQREYDAPPERVFDAWLDPDSAGAWLFATPAGRMTRVEIDPHVGGTFRIVERRGEEDAGHAGVYLAVQRPRRLAFSFDAGDASVPARRDADPVTLELEALRGGRTRLVLVHEMSAEWADYAERTRAGWADILEGLAGALARPGRPAR